MTHIISITTISTISTINITTIISINHHHPTNKQPTRDAVKSILTHMTNPSSATALSLNSSGERLAVIVNNLGGTSKLEELVGMSNIQMD